MLKKIIINSKDRQSGTPYDFKVKLPIRNTQKIYSLMVSKATISHTWYNIQGKSLDFIEPFSNQKTSIPIPDGNYTMPKLLSKINQIFASIQFLNSPLYHLSTITYDFNTGKATLWNKRESEFLSSEALDATTTTSIFKFLNFTGFIFLLSSQNPLSSVSATSGFVNINPNNYLMIKSSALRHQETYEPETTNPNDFNNIIATIPITSNFGEAIIYETTDTENMIKYSSHIPNQIDIKLTFYNNKPAFINTEWSFELSIKYE